MTDAGTPPILLYDGLCGLCNGAVRFVLRHDRRGALRFAPLQGSTAADILARHPHLHGVDSLILVHREGGRETAWTRSDAVLRVLRHLGGPWTLWTPLGLVPRPLRDGGYALVARHRQRIFGRYDACPTPPPELGERFLP